MNIDSKAKAWAVKHRPTTLDDMILDKDKRDFFQNMINNPDNTMSVLLVGSPGLGKTTLMKVLTNELDAEYEFIPCSRKEDRGIAGVARIENFASVMTLDGRPKIAQLDEFDALTLDAQASWRTMFEDLASNCNFIATCNYPGKIIEPLRSRFHVVDMSYSDKKDIMRQMCVRAAKILKAEGVEYTKNALINIVKYNYPDFRKTVNDLQRHSLQNNMKIDDVVAEQIRLTQPTAIKDLLGSQDFKAAVQYVYEEVADPQSFVMALWESGKDWYKGESLAAFIVYLNEAQNEMIQAPDKSLCLLTALVRIMIECKQE